MRETQSGTSKLNSLLKTIACSSGTAQDRRNQYLFVAWCFAWAVFFIAGTWALKSDNDFSAPVAWIIAVIPCLLGLMAVRAYRTFLRMADELMQKMQLEGLAVGFGTGIVFAVSYQILESAGAPHLEIDDLALVMIGGWMLGQVLAFWRYR